MKGRKRPVKGEYHGSQLRWLSVTDAASSLGVSERTISRAIERKKTIKGVMLGYDLAKETLLYGNAK